MKYYIIDTTVTDKNKTFNSIEEVVKYLEGTVLRKFSLSRADYMQNLIDLGYGYDDQKGATFVQSLSEYFNIGVLRNGAPMRTNIHEATYHNKFRKEFGD